MGTIRRFLIVSAMLLAAAVAGLVLGMALAPWWIDRVAAMLELHSVMLRSPSDIPLARWELGAICAMPPVVAWTAMVAHRIRAGADPSLRALTLYLLVPSIVIAAAATRELWFWHVVLDTPGLPATIAAIDLVPSSSIGFGVVSGLLLMAVVAVRARAPGERAR